jgi:predicted RNase H-like HicB family nuclease
MLMKNRPKDYLKEPYARVLVPADDGTFFAEILEFPGCFAQGDTPNEAMDNLNRVALGWIESAQELGQEIPPPFMNIGYSGRIALRLPKSIHKKASTYAERDNVSLNQFFLSAISTRIGAEDFYNRLLDRLEERLLPTARTVIFLSDKYMQKWDEPDKAVRTIPFLTSLKFDEQTASNITEKVLREAV